MLGFDQSLFRLVEEKMEEKTESQDCSILKPTKLIFKVLEFEKIRIVGSSN